MTLHTLLVLFGAGILGGMLSAMVGGASVVTFPALIAAGVPPVPAATCNMTASFPGTFAAALTDRSRLPPLDRAFAGLVLASMGGAVLGAFLLLATPQRVFAMLVPVLLGFATVLFAFARRLGDWLRTRAHAQGRTVDFSVTNLKMLLPVSLYGGYFGAGVGVLLLGVMSVATGGDYRSANVVKNLVTSLNSGAAAAIFIVKGTVVWPATLALMVGSILGGVIGASIAKVMPRQVMQAAVIVIGAALTFYFAWRYWF